MLFSVFQAPLPPLAALVTQAALTGAGGRHAWLLAQGGRRRGELCRVWALQSVVWRSPVCGKVTCQPCTHTHP